MTASRSTPPDPDRRPAPVTRVLGLPVHRLSPDDVVAEVGRAVDGRRRLRVAVLNHSKCRLACRDPRLRRFLEEAEVVVPETSVAWGARVLGRGPLAASWGVALLPRLLDEADRRGWSVYLLGARPEVVDRAARIVRERHPGLELAGAHHGYLDDALEARVRRELADLRPDLLFAGMGSPRQEHFVDSLDFPAGPTVALGVGGSLDVLAGAKRDAPAWIRGSGLEWAFRSLQSPRLLARYAVVLPWFVSGVLAERITGRVPAAPSAPPTRPRDP